MRKSIVLSLLFISSGFFSWWAYAGVTYETLEHNLTKELHTKVTVGYFDTQILKAIEVENFDDVLMYENLAKMLELPLSSSTLRLIESHNGFLETSWRNTKAFTSGFLNGNSSSMVEMSGSIASDLTLYGDLRDLKNEGTKYMEDAPYDAFLLNISLVGIGLSASQLLSAGTTTPLKVGASVLKVAQKSGKLTKSFSKELSQRLSKTVDTKVLDTLDYASIFQLKSTAKTIEKSIDLAPVKTLFKDVNKVKKHTSLTDTISLMKYVDTPQDLKTIGKVSSKYQANTKGVMHVLGKGALRAGKSVVKFTTKLVWKLVGFVLSVLGFLFALVSKWRGIRKFRNIAS